MKDGNKKFIAAAMTGTVIILGCILVYLFTDSGWGKASPALEEAPYTYALDAASFLARLPEAYVLNETGPEAYTVAGEGWAARLTLDTDGQGAMRAFTLAVENPAAPEAPPKDADVLEQRLYAHRESQYKASVQWGAGLYRALGRAMDLQGALTEADLDAMGQAVRTAGLSGKAQEEALGGYLLRAYMDQAETPPSLHASLQKTTHEDEKK